MDEGRRIEDEADLDGSREGQSEDPLSMILRSLDSGSDSAISFVNEFGDFTLAVSWDENQAALNRFMEEQKLDRDLAILAEFLVSQIKTDGKQSVTCCFTGHRPKKIAWLADADDLRMLRLRCALRALIKGLYLNGVKCFISGNAKGFDTIAAEAVVNCEVELDSMKSIGIIPEEWKPLELEIAILFEGHDADDRGVAGAQEVATEVHVVSQSKNHVQAYTARDKYMVDQADLVIALLESEDPSSASGGTARTVAYAEQ